MTEYKKCPQIEGISLFNYNNWIFTCVKPFEYKQHIRFGDCDAACRIRACHTMEKYRRAFSRDNRGHIVINYNCIFVRLRIVRKMLGAVPSDTAAFYPLIIKWRFRIIDPIAIFVYLTIFHIQIAHGFCTESKPERIYSFRGTVVTLSALFGYAVSANAAVGFQ